MTRKLVLYILTGCAGIGATTYVITVVTEHREEARAVEADKKWFNHVDQKDTGNKKVGLR